MALLYVNEARLTVVESVFANVAGLVGDGVDVWQNPLAQAIGHHAVACDGLSFAELHHLLQVTPQEDWRLAFVSDLVHLAATGLLRCRISRR